MKWCGRGSGRRGFSLAILVLVLAARAVAATPEQIDQAITKGQKFLLGKQTPAGSWETDPIRSGKAHNWEKMQGDCFGGFTAIATYALLASGYSAQSSELTKAVDFLRKADVIGIYSLGIRANVWPLLPKTTQNAEWLKAASRKDRDLILQGMINKEGPSYGFWDYSNGKGENPKHPRLDHSVSQYGVLGLWACDRNGADVPAETWNLLDRKWREQQFDDGGWAYDAAPKAPNAKNTGPTASMTAAGVATLFITEDYLFEDKAFACKGNITNPNIEKGLDWMASHFNQVTNTYALYGVERIGVASGRKYFGSVDWFRKGADLLLKQQKPDGSWEGGFPGATPIPTTAFAMLFLSRGRASVLVNKLQYYAGPATPGAAARPEGHWNQRPRDVANIVRWVGENTENDFNWQTINLNAPVVELLDAPVLYISGDQPLSFTPEEAQKLQDFVHMGGMIFGNADCGSEAFTKSFEELGTKWFGHPFRDLPASHPIFQLQQFRANKWKIRPRVQGLSNDVREFMILLSESDPARSWQMRQDQTHPEMFGIGADAFEYAMDKRPSVKGVTYLVLPDEKIKAERSISVALLEAGTNWDPEPGAWKRMAAILHNQAKVDLTVTPVKLGTGKLGPFKIAHLTGTAKFSLTDDQRAELLEWVRHGGTLIIDAAGGSSEFADAAETELKTTFGAEAEKGLQQPLTPDHPMFGIPTMAIQSIGYRPFARKYLVGDTKIPRIRGIEHAGHFGVFYSREDLTEGMVGQQVDGVYGYSPESATELMRNLLLYAATTRTRPAARK